MMPTDTDLGLQSAGRTNGNASDIVPSRADTADSWTMKTNVFEPGYEEEVAKIDEQWSLLAPFFESHGYHLYSTAPGTHGYTLLPPHQVLSSKEKDPPNPYPYARRVYKDDIGAIFGAEPRPRLRPARDKEGREVVIRMVSAGPVESDELKAFRRLNTAQARKDPRNHTLPVIQFLLLEDLTFVVMPRWDDSVFHTNLRFNKVSEYFDVAEAFFEGLAFIHECRIAHRDIFDSNVVCNLLIGMEHGSGLRQPGLVEYAFIDWDSALVLPEDTDISSVEVERLMRRPSWNLRMSQGKCNPFKDDVRYLAAFLNRWLRHLQYAVPDIPEWLDDMLLGTDEWILPAAVWLEELRRIRSTVPQSVLDSEPRYVCWRNGKPLTRAQFGCKDL